MTSTQYPLTGGRWSNANPHHRVTVQLLTLSPKLDGVGRENTVWGQLLKHLGDSEEIVIIGSMEKTSVAKGYQFIRERQQKVGNN